MNAKKGGQATMEVTFRDWGQRGGIWWATEFDEAIPGMLKMTARHARLLDLKANRGFMPRHPELVGEVVSEVAPQLR